MRRNHSRYNTFAIFNRDNRDGALWSATEYGGLTRYLNGVFSTFTTEHGLPQNAVKGVTGDAEGHVWVLSAGQILLWDHGRFRSAALDGPLLAFHVSEWDPSVFWALLTRNDNVPSRAK